MSMPAYDRSHPMASCWEKIKRARQNIADLDTTIASFLRPTKGPYPYRFVGHKSLNEATRIVHHTFSIFGGDPPLDFSVRAGEIVHQLRSSLDHLVWQLVEHNPVTRAAGTTKHHHFHEFPIIWNPKRYRRPKVQRKIQGVSNTAKTLIDSLQPFVTHPHSSHESPLCILHGLDIRDKHLGLNVVVNGVRVSRAYVTDGGSPPGRTYAIVSTPYARASETGTVIASMNSGVDDSQVDVQAEFAPEVAFDKFGLRKNEAIIPSLHQLTDAVIGTLLLFVGEF